jgi:hypothetical protein
LLLGGGAVLGTGLWLFEYFTPSPHMLLEIAVAMPVMGLGGVLASSGLLASRRRLPVAVTVLAVLLFTISLFPVGLSLFLWWAS